MSTGERAVAVVDDDEADDDDEDEDGEDEDEVREVDGDIGESCTG